MIKNIGKFIIWCALLAYTAWSVYSFLEMNNLFLGGF